ncbi:MAG: metalloregulator ArsR/SmtB family transcription factor [Gemmatimonadetes bacterium]|nr:metalloregulator ArsR/SmtB family transcription factor [Gemmatimonadota bacterium]NIO31815.1 metalloregulator ArsR/SmtB family transcription factor [Gemmatimonadota bacterium]
MTIRSQKLSVEAVRQAATMLKCIGHPIRLQIIELLDRTGEQNVTAIYEELEIEQAVASQHLNLMRDKGILASRREGVNVYYSIDDPRVTQVIDCIHDHCDV